MLVPIWSAIMIVGLGSSDLNQYGMDVPECIDKQFTAFHEAGHAVIGIGLGVPFSRASMPTMQGEAGCVSFYALAPTYLSKSWQSRTKNLLAKAAAAGPLAELKFLKSLGIEGDYALAWSDADIRIYEEALPLPNEFYPQSAPLDDRIRQVQAALDRAEVWRCVERLAGALATHQSVSMRDAVELSGMAWKSLAGRY